VANILVISVLEHRFEIGLRRALGAAKAHIRTQFLAEAMLLALLGGTVGVAAGTGATAIYASTKTLGDRDPHPLLGRRTGRHPPHRRDRRDCCPRYESHGCHTPKRYGPSDGCGIDKPSQIRGVTRTFCAGSSTAPKEGYLKSVTRTADVSRASPL
jgi:ABC-type antimicrobial peptide transport system permease subunit